MNLRRLEVLGLAIGLFLSVQLSYIHPDEHFQSLEVLAWRFFGINGAIPWEFQSETAARSFVPLLLNYGPLFCVFKATKVDNPLVILRLVRIQNYLTFIATSRYVMKRLYGAFSAKWCNFFIATSYISGCFQSHSFSNSFETIVLLIVLALYNELLPHVRDHKTQAYKISCLLGFLISLGCFNRITFPAFILFPSLVVFWRFFRTHQGPLALLLVSSTVSSLVFILIDTRMYQSNGLTVAPLRNLLYNFDEANLEKHGLHPRYHHILVNLPQMLGPAILLTNPRRHNFKNSSRGLVISAIASGMLFLSIFRHQELRFLLPLGPLLFACLNPNASIASINSAFIIKLWLVFNVILGTIYGVYHQGGVLKVLGRFQEQKAVGVHVWWKTYSPPTWMYMNKELVVSTTMLEQGIETVDQIPFEAISNHVIDLKGCADGLLNSTLHSFLENGANVKLIAPDSLAGRLDSLQRSGSLTLTPSDRISGHLDLDHLDISDLSTFQPGISVYSVELSR
ncbi:hypothetical protein HG536_0A05050 [Torulaspora globosa]|uniref:Mannosyltransferase n=1 Tax=Torulaspora globosa TaxID=48254 RepID=A0A7G3ZB04_9SACH|nr:uncharacterized protein HG536_0A05050 [Torulaspora globosa]QLL30690.1 hypothetical protein HG536_0A05050 [Torulaspora globosa]